MVLTQQASPQWPTQTLCTVIHGDRQWPNVEYQAMEGGLMLFVTL